MTALIVNELISKIVVHKKYALLTVGKIRIPINIENPEDVDIA